MQSYPPLPPHPNDTPMSGMKTWQVLTAIGIGAFAGVVVVCGGGVALMMVFFQQQINSFNGMMSGNFTVPNLNYTMQVPPDVVEGQPFEIELTLENTGTSPMTLYSLEDYSALTLIQSDPPWQSESDGVMVYQMTLDPGQPQTIKVTARTDMVGFQTLNIDATTDASGMSFTEAYATINVAPAPPEAPDAPESQESPESAGPDFDPAESEPPLTVPSP